MPAIGLLIIIVLPIIYGSFISRIFKDNNPKWSVWYASGFLAIIIILLGSVLISLKLDANLNEASSIFFLLLGVSAIVSIPLTVASIISKRMPTFKLSFKKENLWFIVPAAILGIVISFVYVPSVLNDSTWEVVSTTLSTGRIYEHSSMTGRPMEMGTAGLPIFNKIYVMPMFYTFFSQVFKLDMWVLGGIVLPLIIYITNLCLVYLIAGEVVTQDKRPFFMVVYLMLLMAGTYLPANGIPVTNGYAILREGYSGYAVCYGILAPLLLYWLLKGLRIRAWLMSFSLFALVRLDRIIYAIKEPVKSVQQINASGKLVALYLISLLAAFYLVISKRAKVKWLTFIIPSVAVSMMITDVKELMKIKSQKLVYCLGIAFIIYSCVIFRPFYDAECTNSFTKQDEDVRTTLIEISKSVSEINLWACDEFMFEARRLDGNIKTLYGRDDRNVMMAGTDYEVESDFVSDYQMFIKNKSYWIDYLILEHSDDEIINAAAKEGVNTIVMPKESNKDRYEELFMEAGYIFSFEIKDYLVYLRKDI